MALRQKWQLLWARRPECVGQGTFTPSIMRESRETKRRRGQDACYSSGTHLKINLPNALTLLRIFLVPFLVVVLLTKFDGRETVGLLIFLTAVATDFLDGWLARRRGRDHDARDAARPDRRQAADLGGLHLAGGARAGAGVDGRRRHRPRVRGVGPALDRVGARDRHRRVGLGQGEDVHADRGGLAADPRRAPRRCSRRPGSIALWLVVAVALHLRDGVLRAVPAADRAGSGPIPPAEP